MWNRAVKDTLSFFGWNKRTFIVPILLYLLGAIIYYFWQGKQAMLDEIIVAIAFALIPVGISLLGLFLYHLSRAPVYIKWEKEKEPRLVVTLAPNLEPGDKTHWLRLRVDNPSSTPIPRCYGKVDIYTMLLEHEGMIRRVTDFAQGVSLNNGLPPERHPFPWSSTTTPDTIVTIAGKGHEYLYIAVVQDQSQNFLTPTELGLRYPKTNIFAEYELQITIGSESKVFSPTIVCLRYKMTQRTIEAKSLNVINSPNLHNEDSRTE